MISIWTQGMIPLHDHSQKFISSACLWPFTRQGTVRLNDTILLMLISKLQRMYLVYSSANVMLTKNCHNCCLLQLKWLVCPPLAFQQLAVQYSGGGDNVLNQACHCHRKLCYCWLGYSYCLAQAAETTWIVCHPHRSIGNCTIAWKRAVGGKAWNWDRCQ